MVFGVSGRLLGTCPVWPVWACVAFVGCMACVACVGLCGLCGPVWPVWAVWAVWATTTYSYCILFIKTPSIPFPLHCDFLKFKSK